MSRPLKTVIVNGSLHIHIPHTVFAGCLARHTERSTGTGRTKHRTGQPAARTGRSPVGTDALPAHAHQAICLRAIEQADFLIVGSPIFRAGDSGLPQAPVRSGRYERLERHARAACALPGAANATLWLIDTNYFGPCSVFFQAPNLANRGIHLRPKTYKDGRKSAAQPYSNTYSSVDLTIPIPARRTGAACHNAPPFWRPRQHQPNRRSTTPGVLLVPPHLGRYPLSGQIRLWPCTEPTRA